MKSLQPLTTIDEIMTALIEAARPMTDDTGDLLADTGYLKMDVHQAKISHILSHAQDVQWRSTNKQAVWNFNYNGKAYVLKVRIFGNAKYHKEIILTWDHRVSDPCEFLTAADLWEGAIVAPQDETPAEPAKKELFSERPADLQTCDRAALEDYYEYLFIKVVNKGQSGVPGIWWNCTRQYLIDQIEVMEGELPPPPQDETPADDQTGLLGIHDALDEVIIKGALFSDRVKYFNPIALGNLVAVGLLDRHINACDDAFYTMTQKGIARYNVTQPVIVIHKTEEKTNE